MNTRPKLKEKEALDIAKHALGYQGEFINEPQANLVILPNEMIDSKNRVGVILSMLLNCLSRTAAMPWVVTSTT